MALPLITVAHTPIHDLAFRTNISIAKVACVHPRASFVAATPSLTNVACSAAPPTCIFFTMELRTVNYFDTIIAIALETYGARIQLGYIENT